MRGIGDFQAASKSYDEAIDLSRGLHEYMADEALYPTARVGQADVLREAGGLRAAIVSYDEAIEIIRNGPRGRGYSKACEGILVKALVHQGIALQGVGQYGLAITNCKSAIAVFKEGLQLREDLLRELETIETLLQNFDQSSPTEKDCEAVIKLLVPLSQKIQAAYLSEQRLW